MRDRRFVAVHRGGPLDPARHRLLAAWAADCAERVLPLFEADSRDERPRRAVETARAWARGEVSVGDCQRAAVAAHAAARGAASESATAAARAAGHAVATAHAADHSLGPVIYGLKAVEAAGGSVDGMRAWQIDRLPDEVRDLVVSALQRRQLGRRACSPTCIAVWIILLSGAVDHRHEAKDESWPRSPPGSCCYRGATHRSPRRTVQRR